MDSPARKADLHKPAGLYPCHRQGGNQVHNEPKMLPWLHLWYKLQDDMSFYSTIHFATFFNMLPMPFLILSYSNAILFVVPKRYMPYACRSADFTQEKCPIVPCSLTNLCTFRREKKK